MTTDLDQLRDPLGLHRLGYAEPLLSHLAVRLEDGQVTPHLMGTLHLNNIEGGCARMNIRYLTESGAFLTSRAGGVVCASDNDHHEFTVDLEPYDSNKIGQVNVQLQSQNTNGTFTVVGSETVDMLSY